MNTRVFVEYTSLSCLYISIGTQIWNLLVYRQKSRAGVQGAPALSSAVPVKGPDEEKIKQILARTGYTLDVTTGQWPSSSVTWTQCIRSLISFRAVTDQLSSIIPDCLCLNICTNYNHTVRTNNSSFMYCMQIILVRLNLKYVLMPECWIPALSLRKCSGIVTC